jgi:prepilin-type N-terminal cleavage/methylation domain-containing protein
MSSRSLRGRGRSAGRARAQRGMTLVELLIAMTISLVITAMIILSWVALSGSYANTVRRGKASDFARLALDRMQREIRDAEQPPDGISETAILRARQFYVVVYTTFNKAGNSNPGTPPRQVMFRLYSDGELWRFQDLDSTPNGIAGVNITAENNFSLNEQQNGEGAQMLIKDVVNYTTPSAGSPTDLFSYIYYQSNGSLTQANDVRGTANRAQIRAVELNLLVDLNPGKSPVHWHVRTTAQLRNTR